MGGSELIFVVVVALILFGGKRLPELMRSWGRQVRQMQRAWEEIKRQMGLDVIDEVSRPPYRPPSAPRRELTKPDPHVDKETGPESKS